MSTTYISNARMYAVSPEAEAAWQALVEHVAADAGATLAYLPYPAPQPLEDLWRRPDLGCVQMCGYPIALGIADVVPLAAPIPRAGWAAGRAVYRSDLIVREDAPFETLADTFEGTLGWTVEHSHSGFNALRHHLLPYRSADRPTLYRKTVGHLVTAARILDAVLDGTIDVGPLDAYWHMLIAKYRPDRAGGVRVLAATETAPMPAFVAGAGFPSDIAESLRAAFGQAHTRAWFDRFRDALLIDGFEAVTHETYAATLAWDNAARAAGYGAPV